jgi:predicted enzyme related to lactoylglutathione lyase
MINGVHALIYTEEAEKVRDFFRDVLAFPAVDAGHGWLIFALPPAELGIHPAEKQASHELYLMCDDIQATVNELKTKGVKVAAEITDAGWGLLTSFEIPGGSKLQLYQPKHPTAIQTKSAAR